METELKEILEAAAPEEGFSHFGWTRLERPFGFEIARTWLAREFHGEMGYLERHQADKEEPARRYPQARTVIVVAAPYLPHPEPIEALPFRQARIAAYARGRDYHHWLKERLDRVVDRLRARWPSQTFETHTDSSPLPERDLAARAGVGWIGKNTCAIHPKQGSFFLLGEILTSADIAPAFAPLPDFCGTCRRCIEACPTQALVEPKVLDARRCISYLSIESRAIPDEELRRPWGDWLFGCDICQSVCPWNTKPFRPSEDDRRAIRQEVDRAGLVEDLRWVLTSSGKAIEKALRGTALSRAGGFGLKRNALIVTANRGLNELHGDVATLAEHERLGELARWTLRCLETSRPL